jgi:hypothetical protein
MAVAADRAIKTEQISPEELARVDCSKYRKQAIFRVKIQELLHPYSKARRHLPRHKKAGKDN